MKRKIEPGPTSKKMPKAYVQEKPISYEDLVQRIGMELLPSVKPAPRLPLAQETLQD